MNINFNELFDEIEDIVEEVKNARKQESDGGKRITWKEVPSILLQCLQALLVVAKGLLASSKASYDAKKSLIN